MKKLLNIVLLLAFFFMSCEKADENPPIPEINFISFDVIEGDGEYTTAEGILTFSFIDGDGDIGFEENKDTTTAPVFDIFILEYPSNNGLFNTCDTINYWIPHYFEAGIYKKRIKGELEVKLPRTLYSPDTVKYEFYILDRAMHQSNLDTTPVIIYSELLKQ